MAAIILPEKFLVISLYRSILRHASKIEDYNFRAHALRRTRWGFKVHAGLTAPADIDEKYNSGLAQLQIVRRQSIISQLYPETGSVMQKNN